MNTQEEAFLQPPISWEEIERLRAIKRITQRDVLSSAVKRRLQDVGEREFRAVVAPVGQVGDTSDIQEAADSVHALGGGSIFVKSGKYYPRGNVYLYSNINLIGEDNVNTIFDFGGAAYQFRLHGTSGSRERNVHFKNLQVINSLVSDGGAISFLYTDDCSVRNCKFTNNWESDIKFKESDVAMIGNCYTSASSNFAYMHDCAAWVRDNVITGGTGYGVVSYTTSGEGDLVVATGNLISDMDKEAFWVDQNDSVFSDNAVYSYTTSAIRLTNAVERVRIEKNLISGTGATSKGVFTTASDCDANIISGNIFAGDWDIAIHLDDGDLNQIMNNIIYGSDDAVIIDATCDRTIVTGNNFYGSLVGLTNNGTNTEIGHNIEP